MNNLIVDSVQITNDSVYSDIHNIRNDLPSYIVEEIVQLASTANKEICGVIRDGFFIELNNLSEDPENILIASTDVAEGDILVHSHYKDTQPGFLTDTDIKTAKLLNVATLLYHPVFRVWDYYNPRCDCYSLARDVLRGLFNIHIPDVYRSSANQTRLYTLFREPEKLGFKQTFSKTPGTLALIQVSDNIPYHLAVIVDPIYSIHILETKTELINLYEYSSNVLGYYSYPGLQV
ncbi:hypothetical protein DAPPUDRAFT_335267 [Daphnia pulex]|uniref:NlpC/P60 domain-containing protein n=1 Tax=Daphnia pulex TaxID=6669 RepID=E9HXB1_DAPPU|nr:hypothetical protein DAPPUDRAFT_335267 [Daphnia pulex]|eukprot:EFX63620.1 hypothetical protein DAPPUDRAFT_335267 [Daphnia pulex]